ncbi:bifunctional phosphopantothenoylcysteine decarboxylase/phosphopantothenate--cysteine ligase CoaBC [Helicobacter suis]|nr:bifunctional phosphopantothenoylcysteine decarboxylase/phosphopantothenate--cysteine ligase CoaBC [Helicobacter suis]BCD45324.1 Coenzyme A biosynthesis bifunctional protein CoaBC [Helicobacter suis]BCD46945.1 Coenzyme A biosynthesis bifunctional protein CoaBC [Helicobacter suis]BCD48703.1 Coenzyme A biosynthesis bifunctional protein CoaBC [Helicobacter suis]BCD50483.1 Coenzyme A biosynthesis bifunctional protein CoaBC [Helicobacter suis]BCD69507.1 Coenzyme A biosynthesis bifunctional protei
MLSSLMNSTLLQGKNILLLVSGSIAVYKALDLVRIFAKMGANVRVVMSAGACKFVTPLSFEALSHFSVLTDQNERWNMQEQACTNHITYAKADLVLLAPASANTLAKLAHGLADNALTATFLASHAPKIIAPAMNTQMLQAPATQENLERLKSWGCIIVEPKSDLLACNTTGKGALAEIIEIVGASVKALCLDSFWQDQRVVVTGGGSVEAIDSVRCISNISSGLQASSLALALWLKGAQVVFISSAFALLPEGITCISVKSAQDYLKALKSEQNFYNPPFLFMLAAVSDYKSAHVYTGKLKKQDLGSTWNLECVQNPDILKSLEGFYKIGFKAEESIESLASAQKLLEPVDLGGKGCKVVCLNSTQALGATNNQIVLLNQVTSQTTKCSTKFDLSFEILDFVRDTYNSC